MERYPCSKIKWVLSSALNTLKADGKRVYLKNDKMARVRFLKRKWIFAIVAVAIMLFVLFVPVFPAIASCTPFPSRVLFSASSVITSHQFGAYYVEGTRSYNIAPPSTPPLTTLIVCA